MIWLYYAIAGCLTSCVTGWIEYRRIRDNPFWILTKAVLIRSCCEMPIIGLQARTLHLNLDMLRADLVKPLIQSPPKSKSSSPYNSSQISKNHQHSKPPLRQEVPAPENLLWLSTFSEDNPAGCIRCYCNGVSDECRAAKGWTIRNKELDLTWRVNGGASEARYSQSIWLRVI